MCEHLCIFRGKDLPAAERWYVCYTCRRLLQAPPHIVCRLFWREFHLCSHECWVDFCRGY